MVPPGSSTGSGLPPATLVVSEPLHRLNRLEYNNTVRDLLGTTLSPADAFPSDPSTDGLDNAADGLTMAPALMDLYVSAARDLASATLDLAPRYRERLLATEHHTGGLAFGTSGWLLANGQVNGTFNVPQGESATISVLAGGITSQTASPAMTLWLDGKALKTWTVTNPPSTPQLYTVTTSLSAGGHDVKVTFDNRVDDAPANTFNHLVVGYVEAMSDVVVAPRTRSIVYTCDPNTAPNADACYRTIVTAFASRAWRRPLAPTEADGLFALWQKISAAEGKDEAVKLVVRAALVSPKFLYRVSIPGTHAAPSLAASTAVVPLDDYSLASRLSYFVWSSMPDEALLADARAGALRDDAGLRRTLARMLADKKARGLSDGFAEQWLAVRALRSTIPDPMTYPTFDDVLKQAMAQEAKLFFADFLTNGRPVNEMIAPTFGFLNDRLASHYGLPKPGGAQVARVALARGARGGLLMQGAWLTASSEATRTSPVRRGRFLLEQMLCMPIPAPPPNIPPFDTTKAPGSTIREVLAEHRKSAACSSCHNMLDPLGLGLEQFDGVGALRTVELGKPVDSSGALPPEDRPFVGGTALAALLADDPRFTSCLSQKLLAYALGRKLADADQSALQAIHAFLPRTGGSLDKLVELLVLSPAFRTRPANVTE